MNTNLQSSDKIKMVIFDMDDTFWNGTLSSEKPIQKIDENIAIVKELTDRGIICSISSKNDFDKVKAVLQKWDIWNLFVFPKINWEAKGLQIKNLIEQAQLRAENVLFIDDNNLNLEEALFYSPTLKIALPNILKDILNFEGFVGKNDKSHTRLNQYKLLEEKAEDRKNYSNNDDFLKSSRINVSLQKANLSDVERIVEMILRTNQLNFTKKRITADVLSSLIDDEKFENMCVFVSDRFGDYGMVGYYCLNKENNTLEHFLFSCRIMNLGVEQWVFSNLGFPKLDIIEPVSSHVDHVSAPTWINQKDIVNKNNTLSNAKKIKVLLLGNCDMQALAHYVAGIDNSIDASYHIDISEKTHMQIRYDSIWKMKNALEISQENKKYLISVHKWLDERSFKNRVFEDEYDVLVFSVLNDYMVPIYNDLKTNEIMTPTTSYVTNIFSASVDDVMAEFQKNGIINFSREDVEKYQKNLIENRYMTADDFKSNLEWLISHVKKKIIFLNGPELLHPKDTVEKQERFIMYNKILDQFVSAHKNCGLLDVRKYVKSIADTTDILTHYHRETYQALALDLFEMLKSDFHMKGKVSLKRIKIISFFKEFKENLKKTWKILKNLRRFIFQFHIGRNKKIIRIMGVYLINKK